MGGATRLGKLGVWAFLNRMPAPESAEFAARIEALGYSCLWIPETTGRDPFAHIAYLASKVETLQFATGIASIFHRQAGSMAQAANTLAEQSGGRFILGVGVSHGPVVTGLRNLDYSKPLSQMRTYLSTMDEFPYRAVSPVAAPQRVLAALGPKMLELARDRADGAHSYWTTPEHTASARTVLGRDRLLCVEQKVVLTDDRSEAHEVAAIALRAYADLPNYRNNWKALGFSEDEIESRHPRFLDAVVAWGSATSIGRRIREHYDAGATHVCIQPLSRMASPGDVDWRCLEELASSNC